MLNLFSNARIINVEELPSTNTYMSELLKTQTLTEGTIIKTFHQTAGRGQRNNEWLSEKGKNLTFSLLLLPNLNIAKHFYLNIVAALAVADTLKDIQIKNVKIKWPNDILIADKKVAGILIENTLSAQKITQSIVGIGLNVNQENFRHNFYRTPTSLKIETGKTFDLQTLLKQLITNLENRYQQLKLNYLSKLKNDYLDTLFGYQARLKFESNNFIFEGTIEGIDEQGQLLVKNNSTQTIDAYSFKAIRFL